MKDKDGNVQKIQVNNEKDLGVIFDSYFNFDKHISTKINIANRKGLLSKIYTYMDKDMVLQL